jgi:RNA polymerase sigma-70 factor (ECF subfamily)
VGGPDDLVERCRRGDPEALEQLVREHGPAILRLLARYVGDLGRAEELFQETWLRVKSGLKRFRGEAELGTWIYRIALNLARDDRRRQGRQLDWRRIAAESVAASPMDRLARSEELARLQRAIDELPEPQREALVLSKLEGMTYRQMVQITGAPEGTLRSRVHWAMVTLRRRLGEA